jgi:hypothetical protein
MEYLRSPEWGYTGYLLSNYPDGRSSFLNQIVIKVALFGGAGIGHSLDGAPNLFLDGILPDTSFLKDFQDLCLI